MHEDCGFLSKDDEVFPALHSNLSFLLVFLRREELWTLLSKEIIVSTFHNSLHSWKRFFQFLLIVVTVLFGFYLYANHDSHHGIPWFPAFSLSHSHLRVEKLAGANYLFSILLNLKEWMCVEKLFIWVRCIVVLLTGIFFPLLLDLLPTYFPTFKYKYLFLDLQNDLLNLQHCFKCKKQIWYFSFAWHNTGRP